MKKMSTLCFMLSLLPVLVATGQQRDRVIMDDEAPPPSATNCTVTAGDWHNAAVWSLARVPDTGDYVVVSNSLTLSASTADLHSLLLRDASTITCANWDTCLRADEVDIENGNLTLPPPFSDSEMSNRVWISCVNFKLGANATIDVNGLGYSGGKEKNSSSYGFGPGGTTGTHTAPNSGAGHGGRGGVASNLKEGGITYGSLEEPQTPGSGSGSTLNDYGLAGGGVIRVEAAGHMILDGILTANGISNPSTSVRRAGGGAGGAIWLSCRTFSGTGGVVRANGGYGNGAAEISGGGGGGRIALHYDTLPQASQPEPQVSFNVYPGRDSSYAPGAAAVANTANSAFLDRSFEADWGTLFFSDGSGVVKIGAHVKNLAGHIAFGNTTNTFELDSLTLENSSLGFHAATSITISGDLVCDAQSGLIGRDHLDLNVTGNATFQGVSRFDSAIDFTCDGDVTVADMGSLFFGDRSTLAIGGALSLDGNNANLRMKGADAAVSGYLTVSNGSWLACAGSGTNMLDGSTTMRLQVGNRLALASGAKLYVFADPMLGGTVTIEAGGFATPSGTTIDGDSRGYGGAFGPSGLAAVGEAPNAGGGHGGRGGIVLSGATIGGKSYGDAAAPLTPGSGSAATQQKAVGEKGGAALHLIVNGATLLEGTVSMNGADGAALGGSRNTGGGAGGSFWLETTTLTGTGGVVRANGGNGQSNSGGGGGGRIAIAYNTVSQALMPQPQMTFAAKPGVGFFRRDMPYTVFISGKTHYTHREHEADWGSLWFSDMTGAFSITTSGAPVDGYLLFGDESDSLTLPSLTLASGFLGFDQDFGLTVTGALTIEAGGGLGARQTLTLNVGDGIEVRGTIRSAGPSEITGSGNLTIDEGGTICLAEGAKLVVGGNLLVTNELSNLVLRGALCDVGGQVTVSEQGWLALMGYGAKAGTTPMTLQAGGDFSVHTNSKAYILGDAAEGGIAQISCRNFKVESGAEVVSFGYVADKGTGKGASGNASGGGAFGGNGGNSYNNKAGGTAYGNTILPLDNGSGGGAVGGYGGGLVYVRAQRGALVNGVIDAAGKNAPDTANNIQDRAGGGGGGGGITLVLGASLRGGAGAMLSAAGGAASGPAYAYGGGGGGGRIAVWEYVDDSGYADLLKGDFHRGTTLERPVYYLGDWSVAGGIGYNNGTDGTVVFYRTPPTGTLIILK